MENYVIRLGTSILPMLVSAPYPPELGMSLDLVKASAWAFPSHRKHSPVYAYLRAGNILENFLKINK